MDWKNEESDYSSVENVTWDKKTALVKTTSNVSLSGIFDCNVCSQGVQVGFEGCKESRSFTSAFERLELETETESRNEPVPIQRTCDAQTESFDDDKEDEITNLRTDDFLSRRSVNQHSDILTFQGRRYSPNNIARYWKKDSRMWLWKSANGLKRKQNKPEATE